MYLLGDIKVLLLSPKTSLLYVEISKEFFKLAYKICLVSASN